MRCGGTKQTKWRDKIRLLLWKRQSQQTSVGFCINLKLQNYKIMRSSIGVLCTNQFLNHYFLSLFFFLNQCMHMLWMLWISKICKCWIICGRKFKCYEFIHPKIIMHIHESRLHNIFFLGGRGRHNNGYIANLASDGVCYHHFLPRIIMIKFNF